MNVLLIGGQGNLMNKMIIKFRKEGHRVYVLTGNKYRQDDYEKVFEKYCFDYDSENLKEVFGSVDPDVTIFMGAYDTNFHWTTEQRESVRFAAGMMNILVAYSMINQGRFILLSSDEVFGEHADEDICEDEKTTAVTFRGMALAQAEELCGDYHRNLKKDIVVLRLDHMYSVPETGADIDNVAARMCLEALKSDFIMAQGGAEFSMLYEADAVEFIFRVAKCKRTQYPIYHISSGKGVTEAKIADEIAKLVGETVNVVVSEGEPNRRILSNKRFDKEFGANVLADDDEMIEEIVSQMVKNKEIFLSGGDKKESSWKKMMDKSRWVAKSIVPFLENIICFLVFFVLNSWVGDSGYLGNLDFYLLYVLLFAVTYGQQQAVFSAVLSVAGYCFRHIVQEGNFDVILAHSTYIWMAQLFILGLVVGYMRDEIRITKTENDEEREHLRRQLKDVIDINSSNVRVKDVLERQVIDQRDSIGKVYSITSKLDRYMPDEVLFYAVETVGQILDTGDVAIYNVYNESYARMFSASSAKARQLGNSILYREMEEMYEVISQEKVYINRQLDDRYPLMANAIFENETMKMIVMVWGLSWERMTLGQANLLKVVSSLIQNAVLRANSYMEALESKRYREDTNILEPEAFTSLVHAYGSAKAKNLTECTLLELESGEAGDRVSGSLTPMLRQTDYLGIMEDGNMYVLLANTNKYDARTVVERFAHAGFDSRIVEKVKGLS